jgi:hypothetical protein
VKVYKVACLFVSLFLSAATVASADIIDRINACERENGGACVFNLLRELALSSPNRIETPRKPFCRCNFKGATSTPECKRINAWNYTYTGVLVTTLPNGIEDEMPLENVSASGCVDEDDQVIVECKKLLKDHPECNR